MDEESVEAQLKSLRGDHGEPLVDALAGKLRERIAVEIDPAVFAQQAGPCTPQKAADFLAAAAQLGLIEEFEGSKCSSCSRRLEPEAAEEGECPCCSANFRELGTHPVIVKLYRVVGGSTRDVPWTIVIHGMNTAGEWQEEFSWRIATKLKYSAPVFIYKYGLLRFGVLARWRHKMLARQLGGRLKEAFRHAERQGHNDRPDVVIHSFGSQLFVLLLADPEFAALRFGRVIATGTIIDPNYDWSAMIADERVEAVLNHCGKRDWAVPWAQWMIPRTGPGARKGFSDPEARNLFEPDYGHSDCFGSEALAANLGEDGAWDRFIRFPKEDFTDPRCGPAVRWRRIPRWITFSMRMLLIALGLATAIFIGCLAGYGLWHGFGPVWGWFASIV